MCSGRRCWPIAPASNGNNRYGDMLAQLCADHCGPTHGYYLDVPFAETVARHTIKSIAVDVSEMQLMRRMPFGHVLRGQRVLTCAASTRCPRPQACNLPGRHHQVADLLHAAVVGDDRHGVAARLDVCTDGGRIEVAGVIAVGALAGVAVEVECVGERG